MEGNFRPGHFEGVIEVVKRLLTHIKTNYLFLGKKDYQQLIVIKKYLESIDSKIKVVPCDTIRAKNGVALSSRNKLLDQKSLNVAGDIINFLKKNKNQIIKSKNNSLFINKIKEFGAKKIDYLSAFNFSSRSFCVPMCRPHALGKSEISQRRGLGSLKIKASVHHLVLHMLQHNGSRDLRTHDPLVVYDHAVALMAGLIPDWTEGIGGSKAAERAVIF